MSTPFSLGKSLLRAAVSLGFLGCLIAADTVSSQAATSESAVATGKAVIVASAALPSFCGARSAAANNCSHMLSEQVEIGFPDEFGTALEDDDSIEMLRVDLQERIYGGDRVKVRPKFASKAAADTRPSISPPLLV